MADDKKTLRITQIGFLTAIVAMATTVIDRFSGFITGRRSGTNAPGTNAPGTNAAPWNAAGTNAAADPMMKVPGNTGTVDYKKVIEEVPDGLVMPWHWVIIILCLLTALLCILIYKKVKKRRYNQQAA